MGKYGNKTVALILFMEGGPTHTPRPRTLKHVQSGIRFARYRSLQHLPAVCFVSVHVCPIDRGNGWGPADSF